MNIPLRLIPATAMLAVCALLFSANSQALTEAEKQAKLEDLRATIEQVKKELENVKSNRNDILKDLEKSETKIGELDKKVEELKSELNDKQSSLRKLRNDKEQLATVKKQQTQAAGAHLNAAYRLGNQSNVKLLLNQQEPASVARNLKYFDYIVNARNTKISELLKTLADLNQLEPQIEQQVIGIQNRRERLLEQERNLVATQKKRAATLKKLESALANQGAKLDSLQQSRSDLESVVTHVTEISDDFMIPGPNSAPFASLKGKLPWPTHGKVLRSYGSERVKGKLRWQGMLISANVGDPVQAIHAGRVVFSDYLRGQGLLIIVDHGAGFMSLYAHNQALYKQLGDWVQAGEQIATVGLSGGQTTASLYFELRVNGEPTNPHGWLKRA